MERQLINAWAKVWIILRFLLQNMTSTPLYNNNNKTTTTISPTPSLIAIRSTPRLFRATSRFGTARALRRR